MMKGHRGCVKHRNYHLTCTEYDLLIFMSAGVCDICGRLPKYWLCIDHDHDLGWRAVRGTLCESCNTTVGKMDAGFRISKPIAPFLAYLGRPWHEAQGFTDFACPDDCTYGHHRPGTGAPGKPRALPKSRKDEV